MKYKIQRGDTLYSIAKNNNINLLDLLAINKQIKNPDIIRTGEEINLLMPKEKQPEPQKRFLDRFKKPKNIKYQIQQGDNLYDIAKQNELNVNQLLGANKQIKNPDMIRAGQEINIPRTGIVRKEEFKERLNLPAGKPQERKLPSNIRQLLTDINPINRIRRKLNLGMDDFTEADATPEEIKALTEIVKANLKEGKTTIGYEDFKTSKTPYGDVGGSRIGMQKVYEKFKDPRFSLKTLIGQANITTNDKGETIVIDRYNFNEEEPNSFRDYARKIARALKDPTYGLPRELGSVFGSNEGEGSFIRLNLGVLDI